LKENVAVPIWKAENTAVVMSRWPRGTLQPQKWALTSPTSGSRSVGIVSSRTQATELTFFSLTVSRIHQLVVTQN
jgi:hypothetical protein